VKTRGFAAAQCGKALPYRSTYLLKESARLSLADLSCLTLAGKPQAFRTVLRQSRHCFD